MTGDVTLGSLNIIDQIFSQVPFYIAFTDADGKIIYLNEAFSQTMGYSLAELRGTVKIFNPDNPGGKEAIREITEAITSHQVWQGDMEVETRSGKRIWLRGMISTVADEQNRVYRVSVFNDVPDVVNLRLLHHDEECNYKTVFDNIPIGISIIDKNGKFLFTNPYVRRLFAPGRAEQENLTVFDILPRESAEQAIQNICWIIENKVPIRSESHLLLSDKEFYFDINRLPLFDISGNVTSVLYLTSDITDRKRQEQLIQIIHNVDSLSNLATTLDESLKMASRYLMQLAWVDGLGIYLFNESHDTLELVHVKGFKEKFINHAARYPAEGLYLNRLMKRMPTFFKISDLQDPIKAYMQEEGLVSGAYIPLIYQDEVIGSLNLGSRKVEVIDEFNRNIVESIAASLANLIMLVKTRSQLAETTIKLKKNLNELIVKQQMLIQKSRLESLGELSAGLAHEINQPLTVVALIMENIAHKIDQGPVSKTYLRRKFSSINQSLRKIQQLIDHIRIFSHDQTIMRLERFDVNSCVGQALSMIGAQLRNRNIRVVTDLCTGAGYTLGNISRLEQVILNLLTNARDALDEKTAGGLEPDQENEIRISTRHTGETIELKVWDNGSGIAPENLDKLFLPFYTTKADGKGTGLGLPIVYGIIQEMKGDIRIDSQHGQFTEVTIILPRYVQGKREDI